MTSIDRIDLALRSAFVAAEILNLTRPISKTSAQVVMEETKKMLADLNATIKALPED